MSRGAHVEVQLLETPAKKKKAFELPDSLDGVSEEEMVLIGHLIGIVRKGDEELAGFWERITERFGDKDAWRPLVSTWPHGILKKLSDNAFKALWVKHGWEDEAPTIDDMVGFARSVVAFCNEVQRHVQSTINILADPALADVELSHDLEILQQRVVQLERGQVESLKDLVRDLSAGGFALNTLNSLLEKNKDRWHLLEQVVACETPKERRQKQLVWSQHQIQPVIDLGLNFITELGDDPASIMAIQTCESFVTQVKTPRKRTKKVLFGGTGHVLGGGAVTKKRKTRAKPKATPKKKQQKKSDKGKEEEDDDDEDDRDDDEEAGKEDDQEEVVAEDGEQEWIEQTKVTQEIADMAESLNHVLEMLKAVKNSGPVQDSNPELNPPTSEITLKDAYELLTSDAARVAETKHALTSAQHAVTSAQLKKWWVLVSRAFALHKVMESFGGKGVKKKWMAAMKKYPIKKKTVSYVQGTKYVRLAKLLLEYPALKFQVFMVKLTHWITPSAEYVRVGEKKKHAFVDVFKKEQGEDERWKSHLDELMQQ